MTVGCVLPLDAAEPETFHSGVGKEMTAATATEMLERLEAADTVVTFNGAAFDFKFLAAATDADRVAAVAKKSIDLLLCAAAATGYAGGQPGAWPHAMPLHTPVGDRARARAAGIFRR
jgi:hypothetical protein